MARLTRCTRLAPGKRACGSSQQERFHGSKKDPYKAGFIQGLSWSHGAAMPDARALAGLARGPCFDRAVLFRRPRRRARLQWCQMPILPLLPGCQAVWGYFIAGFRRGFQKLGAPCSYEGQLMTVALLQNQQQALGRERMTSVQLQSKGHRIPRTSVREVRPSTSILLVWCS